MGNGDSVMSDRLAVALLILRLTLGIFLLQWGVEKLVHPEMSSAIFDRFYGVQAPAAPIYAAGIAEILIALALAGGLAQPVTYWLALGIHAVTVVVSWRQLTHPWMSQGSHLFIASVPVLAAFVTLVMLRQWDVFSVDHRMGWLTHRMKRLPQIPSSIC